MAERANDVVGVVLGEAKARSYSDMLHVASVVANRARALGVSMEDVVRNAKEFNAYGKALPPGVSKYKDMAKKAITQVLTKGPVTPATFYATPSASKNLPKGLQKVTSTIGHEYYVDPKNRAINTAVGYRKPDPKLGMMNLAPSMVQDGTVKSAMADSHMDPRLGNVVSSLSRAGFGDVSALSGFRDPVTNARVGGAKKSQHLRGTAIDVMGLGMTPNQKADMLDRALMAGVRGVGLYTGPKQGIHLDVRGTPSFWSGNYTGLTAKQAPSWAQNQIGQLLSLDETNTYLPTRPANTPIPTPRAAMAMMAKAPAPAPSKSAVKAGYQQYANSRRAPQEALVASATPAPTTRQVERNVATRTFNPGGILTGKAAVSLSPVSSAQASTRMPSRATSLPPDRQMPSGPVAASRKTSTGLSYSLAQPARDVVAKDRQMSYSPAAPMSVGKYSPVSKPSALSVTARAAGGIAPAAMAAGYGQMAASRQAPVASPAAVKAGYQHYGMLRATTPDVAPVRSVAPAQQAYTPAPTAKTAIAGPLSKQGITATQPKNQLIGPVAPAPTIGGKIQKAVQKAFTPENIASASLAAAGTALAGPVGGILGSLIGRQIGKNGIGPNVNNQPMSINNIGGGLAAVSQAMGGTRGTQANYSSPGGGGTVTSLGNGSYSRTSNKYGWSEVTDASGRTSASGKFGGIFGGLFGGGSKSTSGKKK